MNEFILPLTCWHWIGLATIIFIFEILTGSGFLLWVGIAALLVSFTLFFIPSISLITQLSLFALLGILSAIAWRAYLNFYPIKTDNPNLNRRAEQYIGRTFVLKTSIVNGLGKIHVDDTMWRVKCDKDLPAGKQVRVIGADGVILIVELK